MKTFLLFVLASAVGFHSVAGPIPSEFVGEWVSADARFNREFLAYGAAVYIGADGLAAWFGANKMDILGMAGTGTYDSKKSVLILDLRDRGTPPLREKAMLTYDSKSKTLAIKGARDAPKEVYKLRQRKIPKWVTDEVK